MRLNRAQNDAVEHGEGPLLVLAGAGSGKTRVITNRIVRLVSGGVPARAIVALTFTNKAAGEMRERVTAMLGDAAREREPRRGKGEGRSLTVSTFHSFGLDVLGREREAVGGRFTIFDQGDQVSLVKQLLRDAGADRAYDSAAVLGRISNAKNAFQSAAELPERDEYDSITKAIYPRYQAALRAYKAFDFDDLVCEVARLWRDRDDVRGRWQSQFLHVLVDEYQDTNRAQLEMLRLLVGTRGNVCAVGDDDQAIYGWRGADVRNILDFDAHFKGARVIKLEQNYRSHAPILKVANAVIAKRTDSKWRKELFTERAGGGPVYVAVAPTPEVEASWVAREIRRLVREGKRPKEIAVLYRSNGQSRLLEENLREQGVAHRVVGGTQFFERKEVKDLLAYLKLALNLSDEISLRRVVNYPARGIGETTLERLVAHAYARGWSLWQAIERVDALDDVPNGAREGCRALEQVIREARLELFGDPGKPPSEVARAIAEKVNMRAAIETGAPAIDVAAKRWGNVEGVLSTLAKREAKVGIERGLEGLAGFLQMLTMDQEVEVDDKADVVTLSTLHGSKGLEFEAVFLVGCEEGYLPHQRTLETRATDVVAGDGEHASDIEEERRLFYVGVTRAKERLTLSRARSRVLRGKAVPRTPSRFLLDIPAELLEEAVIKEEGPTSAAEAHAAAEAILAMLQKTPPARR